MLRAHYGMVDGRSDGRSDGISIYVHRSVINKIGISVNLLSSDSKNNSEIDKMESFK